MILIILSTENRLCKLIVREHFGPIVEKVANALLRKGRLPVGMIVATTKLSPAQVRESLVVMIQHNIAVYAETQERTRIVTYYEVNRIAIMHRAQIPKMLFYAQEWFEKDGALVAQSVMTHGKLTMKDCINDILASRSADVTKSDKRVQLLTAAFTRMVKERCLIAVRPSDSVSQIDRDMEEESRETSKSVMPVTATELAKIRKTMALNKEAERESTNIIGLKRKLNAVNDMDDWDDFDSTDKRRKVGGVSILEEVEDDVYFRINFERFIIRWRNIKIAELIEGRLNSTAKAIMSTLLMLAESKMLSCTEEWTKAVSSVQILNNLPQDVNLVDTLAFENDIIAQNAKPSTSDCLEKYMEVLEEDLLKITKKDQGRSGQYVVNLKQAAKVMKHRVIEGMVSSRFGGHYVRIMNMLLEKGKSEEKQISKWAMMPVKDVREKLTTLYTFGVLNMQEVPKSADRAPSRTFYLWEVLPDRASEALVEKLIHTMANLRQRRFVERAKRQILLEKCERTDVQANDGLLSSGDKRELEVLNNMLEMLEVQELRIADMVMTLRDF
ncbi:RNA polymerase III subunit C82 [Actinomortierella wolfii]|nr:RNA polymerase III subunit C82 [Actinomortierella wolfii]